MPRLYKNPPVEREKERADLLAEITRLKQICPI
jgi:hypothetical protein